MGKAVLRVSAGSACHANVWTAHDAPSGLHSLQRKGAPYKLPDQPQLPVVRRQDCCALNVTSCKQQRHSPAATLPFYVSWRVLIQPMRCSES